MKRKRMRREKKKEEEKSEIYLSQTKMHYSFLEVCVHVEKENKSADFGGQAPKAGGRACDEEGAEVFRMGHRLDKEKEKESKEKQRKNC